jgi:hypothetical protein
MAFVNEAYENVFIGNFLYGFGLAMGAHPAGKAVPAAINLVQQTPLDPKLGDLLIEVPGTIRLFEFKRSGNSADSKEKCKATNLRIAVGAYPHLVPLSRNVHWLVRSLRVEEGADADMEVAPYLDMHDPALFTTSSLSALIKSLVAEVVSPGTHRWSPAQMTEYLALVGKFQGSGSASGGGFLIHVDDKGCLRYAALNDMLELGLQQSKYIEKHNRMVVEHARQLELSRQRELQRQRGLERDGPSR